MSTNPEIQSLVTTNLATVCVESALTGVFWVLYALSTFLLVQRARDRAAQTTSSARSIYKTPMFIASHIIAATVTAHWSITVYRLFYAFVIFMGGTEPLIVYANIAEPSEIAKTALFVATVLASDAMIIFRLYIIWGYNKWIVIFPIMTWFGLIVCGVGLCWRFSLYRLGEDAYHDDIGRWITSDCVMTFVTNLYCTVCIAWRIWRTRIRSKSFGGGNLMGVLAIVIESALIHTCWNLFFLLEFQLQSVVQFTAIDVWSPVCGITFMLINFRVALGWAQKAHSHSRSGGSAFTHRLPTASAHSTSYPLRKQELASAADSVPYSYKEPYTSMMPHPYAAPDPAPFTVNITRVVDTVDDNGSSVPYEGEA
ncbi:uncharacterized protein B0H18DRAFT_869432 [Fomitopsis serialis]|uniref:uncharacterized protein n=1 Tax=Fomitopsis serialis TaxID=139415 RepID=UPI0020089E9E|nr:uncharacterized protein B0H18DRAFT_869432 [Neoantrodia serialis]KAH9934651.1 hypothetical protein B0H18DRAFT_869432 [Neoantrodia serialis]